MVVGQKNATKKIRLSFRPLWLSVPCLIGITFFWGGLLIKVHLNGLFLHLDFLALGTTVLSYAFLLLFSYQVLRLFQRRMILSLVRIQVWITLVAMLSLLLLFIMVGHSGQVLFGQVSRYDFPTLVMFILAISSLTLGQILWITNIIIGLSGRQNI